MFRSDGASRRSREQQLAGWGAARWSEEGVLVEVARGYLRDVSNNIAECNGLAACMHRAVEVSQPGWIALFEVDSLLISRQVQVLGNGKFACRSASLTPMLLECIELGRELEARDIHWKVRHIY